MNAVRCSRSAVSLPAWRASQLSRLPRHRTPRFAQTGNVFRRWETSTTGDDKSGHIAAQPGEGIIFFDNVFPLRVSSVVNWRLWLSASDYTDADVSTLLRRLTGAKSTSSGPSLLSPILSMFDPVAQVQRAIPADLPLTITEIVPRLKDGGVFIKFRHPADLAATEIEESLTRSLYKSPVRPWFNPLWGCMRAGLVRGVPWLEDLASRVPSERVRVEFCAPPPPPLLPSRTGAASSAATTAPVAGGDASGSASLELSQETIYSLFRRYGKIAEISSQPFESKTLPRYTVIDFVRVRDAVLARSCLHGYVVNGATRLRLSYEPRARAHHIWDWLTSHQRIVVPILAALLATVTVAVFDPIRTFFIRAHVQHSFALRDSSLYKWLQRRTSAMLAFARDSYDAAADGMGMGSGGSGVGSGSRPGLRALLSHRRDLLDWLNTWLLETSETFIVVQGPRGSGKRELVVDQALSGRRDVLVIDCKPIVEARGESATIKKMANAVGYRPVFSWANNISSLVDLAVQGTTGVKSGFSETLDEQLAKILQTAAVAMRQVGLAGRHKSDIDASLNEDAYLEAHPERRPVIVLDNFGQRNEDATGLVYDKLAEWAAALVQANVAHVVFLTSDTSYPKALVKALPDRVFRQMALGDLSPAVAKKYVLSHLAVKEDDGENSSSSSEERKTAIEAVQEESVAVTTTTTTKTDSPLGATQTRREAISELDECIGVLGGRLTDLESLVRRLKSGQRPKRAVTEIVDQSATEIIKMFLLAPSKQAGGSSSGSSSSSSSSGSGAAPGGVGSTAGSRGTSSPRAWTAEQAWYLVREVAAKESLRYNEVLLSDLFATADGMDALDALAAAELVTIRSARGRPQTIRAGSPVYQAAFSRLRSDTALAARLDRSVLAARTAVETKAVAKAEEELVLLGSLPRQPAQTTERVQYLLMKLQTAQARVTAYDTEMSRLKKVMSEEV
ncbi:mitochondrial escape protein [Grosmannia clavigera kw1407]|uniref:Mitochondrial escape protein 2 n=1 Tax=Grosmannia clavigera (strain kw1407 / UAMH 11150) TaxID=655863 RepID=F0XA23_GROCL|nr:mitochondrial escape protein [Grosmannia clavigera kw1407]EFX05931.1 mitochondrial escape protein [Grosmannia clavigera kw1407]